MILPGGCGESAASAVTASFQAMNVELTKDKDTRAIGGDGRGGLSRTPRDSFNAD
jgi:hypothetical protein